MTLIYLTSIVFVVISMGVSMRLKAKFKRYALVPLPSGLSGKEVAERMLRENGIYDVSVHSSNGFLSDHYNPANKTVNLSPDVYNGRSVSAAAVAAHECGHAVQHATAYPWLMMRSRLVPVVQFSSSIVQWVLLAGIMLVNSFPQLLLAGIVLFALTTIFALVTLPVEFDASKRGLVWLENAGLTSGEEHTKAKHALRLAATTYIVAALSAVAMLLYFVLRLVGGRD